LKAHLHLLKKGLRSCTNIIKKNITIAVTTTAIMAAAIITVTTIIMAAVNRKVIAAETKVDTIQRTKREKCTVTANSTWQYLN